MIGDMVREGKVVQASTPAELARTLRLPDMQLEATLRQYNAGASCGVDGQGKEARFLRPVNQAPYYGAEVRLATIASTWTGLEINGRAEVLGPRGDPIPGLFAAGETTGGVLSWVYAADGNNLGNGATFGRVAGRTAAEHVGGL
jgi:fumarate reductase flavoprotein subunit